MTQHSLTGGRYPLPVPDLHRLDLTSFCWRTHEGTKDTKFHKAALRFRARTFDPLALGRKAPILSSS